MSKIKIKIAFLGHLPHSLDTQKIKNWKSDLFEILTPIDTYTITANSDGSDWEYTDEVIQKQLPQRRDADILLIVTNVPIQNNYFARRFPDNRICITYNEMAKILKDDNIPLENLMLRVLYSVSFLYKKYNRIPLMSENTNFTHDETRGCIFDMDGIKTDTIYSTNQPQICHSCVESLTVSRVEKNLIDSVQKELKKIKKGLYYQIADFVKTKPILSFIITLLLAFMINLSSNFAYDLIKLLFTVK